MIFVLDLYFNTSRADPERKEKINVNFHFHTCLYSLWGTLQGSVKKTSFNFYFYTTFQLSEKILGVKGLRAGGAYSE